MPAGSMAYDFGLTEIVQLIQYLDFLNPKQEPKLEKKVEAFAGSYV